ncbi:alpha-(1,3)-fucosyltransferase 10-like [Mytilus trossulus]|uniref:alpha-(1,3)-fucosyltransferase 10-like n=1 Tax=Mytilus trossulus TaxID=6551 RepID=UPI00300573D1
MGRILYIVIFLLLLISIFMGYLYVSVLPPELKLRLGFHVEEQLNPKGEEPIIIWWSFFSNHSTSFYSSCDDVKCFVTNKKEYQDNPRNKAFLFDGTFLKPHDLPLPRQPDDLWGLFQEESPKNNYLLSHSEVMDLFNITSTFRRESTFPILLRDVQSIDWLESSKYFVPTLKKNKYLTELSPVVYVHSDCNPPSGRDEFVKELMKYLKVDSYGKCLHNKDLPESLIDPLPGMFDTKFYKLMAKYKFTLAMENSICDDYITEKLWRPLYLGSVPIVLGSTKVQDFLPSNHSAIIIKDISSPKKIADYIHLLNNNDDVYNEYTAWKKTGVTNTYLKHVLQKRDFMDPHMRAQCNICKILHENKRRTTSGLPILRYRANHSHFGCPGPVKFNPKVKPRPFESIYRHLYYQSIFEAKAVSHFAKLNRKVTSKEFNEYLSGITTDVL